MALEIDYNGLVNKTVTLLKNANILIGITIETQEASGNSKFPHIYVMRPAGEPRGDEAVGGNASSEETVIVAEITTYQGVITGSTLTQKGIEEQAYTVMNKLRKAVESNRNNRWDGFSGVHDVWNGRYSPVEAMKGFYKLQSEIRFLIMEVCDG